MNKRNHTSVVPLDEARLLPRLRSEGSPILDRATLRLEQAAALTDAAAANTDGKLTVKQTLTKPGDPRKLRGIPVQARGVGGTSPSTDPVAVLLAKERQREKLAA